MHQLSTDLVARFEVIAIEDLNVAGMLKNHPRARMIAGMGVGESRRHLEYKAAHRGTITASEQSAIFYLFHKIIHHNF